MKSPITKLAALVIILAGLFFSANLVGGQIFHYFQQRQATKDSNDITQTEPAIPDSNVPVQIEPPIEIADESPDLTNELSIQEEGVFENPVQSIQEPTVAFEPDTIEQPITSNNESEEPPEIQTGVSGIVVDKDTYQPIQDAQVGFRPSEMVTTSTDGQFQLDYTGNSEEPYLYIYASGYASQRMTIQMKPGGLQNITIELNPGSKTAGIVTDSDGQPVEGAEVAIANVTHPTAPVITDNVGQFEIDGLDPIVSTYRIRVSHPAYPAVHIDFKPPPVGQIYYQDIILEPGVIVFGQVTDSQGKPIPGVTVGNTTSRAHWNNITVETDEDGMYLLDNMDVGELVLWAVHGRYAPFVEYTTLESNQTQKYIDIQLKAPRALHGLVVDSQSNPVPGAIVTIDEYDGVRLLDNSRHLCDSDGGFTIANAPTEGNLILWVFGEGICGTEHKVDLSLDECLITVERSGKIYGRVVDNSTNEPITKFLIKLTDSRIGTPTWGYASSWSVEGHTFDSSQGLFDTGVQNIPVDGQFRITVSAEGYEPLSLDPVIVQPASDNPDRTEFRLKPTSVFVGRVMSRDSQPIQGASIIFFSEENFMDSESWPRALTDKTGIFTISGLGNKPQCLFVSASGYAPGVYLMSELLEVPNHLRDIVLDQAAALYGYVLDENGQGLEGARVRASVDTSQIRDIITFSPSPSLGPGVNTDKNGYYYLSDVPTGQVQISVQSPTNYNIGHKIVELKPGDLKELNFGDEGGFVITGTIRADGDILRQVQIILRSQQTNSDDNYSASRETDIEGQFKFIHVPEGTYSLYMSWGTGESRVSINRQLTVERDMELEIDMQTDTLTDTLSGITIEDN